MYDLFATDFFSSGILSPMSTSPVGFGPKSSEVLTWILSGKDVSVSASAGPTSRLPSELKVERDVLPGSVVAVFHSWFSSRNYVLCI